MKFKSKQSKELLIQLRKLGLGFILLTLLYFEKYNNNLSLIDVDAHIKFIYRDFSHIKLLRVSSISISRIFIKTLYDYDQMLIKIIILNLFLAFKCVKHYHLGQKLGSTFQSNLRIKMMVNKLYN